MDPNFSKVYLKQCRWCKHQFYTHQPNKLYCSAKHQYEATLYHGRKRVRKHYQKNKIRINTKKLGSIEFKNNTTAMPSYLGAVTGINPQTQTPFNISFYCEYLSIQKLKKQTFVRGKGKKGKQNTKSTLMGATSSLPYQYVTEEDLHNFSISYLKDNQIKCPECSTTQNQIEHGLNVCRACGLVLKAPSVHPGYVVDDNLPKWKVSCTVTDINLKKTLKEAHHLAYSHYWEQVEIIDPTPEGEEKKGMSKAHWKHYNKKVYQKS